MADDYRACWVEGVNVNPDELKHLLNQSYSVQKKLLGRKKAKILRKYEPLLNDLINEFFSNENLY